MWRCHVCSESVEEAFQVCWNCGADRTGTPDATFVAEPQDPAVPDAGPEPEKASRKSAPLVVGGIGSDLRWVLRRLAVLVHRRSHLVIAMGLQGLSWLVIGSAVDVSWAYGPSVFATLVFGIALFVPGAVRRWNLRHLAGMAALGAVVPLAVQWSMSPWTKADSPAPVQFLWPVALISAVGAGEVFLSRKRSWRMLGWTVTVGVAAAMLFATIDLLLRPSVIPASIRFHLSTGLLAATTWVAVPLGMRLARPDRTNARRATLALLVASSATYVLLLQFWIYDLGRLSAERGYPFSQRYGIWLLHRRGRDSDYELILQMVRGADWSRPDMSRDDPRDWRWLAVQLVVKRDPHWAAEELAQLLHEHPSPYLIDMTGDLFVKERRYDVVPILTRYAATDSLSVTQDAAGTGHCLEALERLQVPQAAVLLLYRTQLNHELARLRTSDPWWSDYAAAYGMPKPATSPPEDAVLSPELRRRLRDLLGKDAGSDLGKWWAVYNERIDEVPTPLSPKLHEETNRVLEALFGFQKDFLRSHKIAQQLAEQQAEDRLQKEAPPEELKAIEEFRRKRVAGEKIEFPSEYSPLGRAAIQFGEIVLEAREDLEADPPNLDVPTTPALEAEITAYRERVAQAVRKAFSELDPERTVELDLTGVRLTSDEVSRLKTFTRLETLNLSGTGLTDDDLHAVAKMTHLKELRLSRLAITDAGLAKLEGPKSLTYLDLIGTNVTASGVLDVYQEWPAVECALDAEEAEVGLLSNQANRLVREAKPEQALAAFDELVRRAPRSSSAHFDRAVCLARLGRIEQSLAEHAEAVRLNPRWAARYYEWRPEDPNAGLRAITRLELSGCALEDGDLSAIAPLANLRRLNLGDTQITDTGLSILTDHKALEEVFLARTKVSDAGLARLAQLPRLEFLGLEGTAVTNEGLRRLYDCRRLKYVGLKDTKVTEPAIKRLKEQLPELHVDWEGAPE